MRFLTLLYLLLGLALPAAAADINGQLKRADLENLSADPSLAATGRIYYNTGSAKAKYWTGSAWLTIVDTTNTLLNGAVQNPMSASGDLIYGGSSGTPTRLAGNTAATKKFLTQTGTGSASAAPSWGTVADSDLPTTLTSHTLATPTLSSYGDLTEQASAPSSPSSSTLRVYAKTDDKLYTLNNSGVETQVGSGSGEKNYLQKGASTAAGWTASGSGITCTTVTTGLPDASVGTALAVTGVSGSSAFCYFDFDVDQADYSKVLKLAFDQAPVSGYAAGDFRVDVYSCTVAFSSGICSGTLTRLPLSTDSSSVTSLPALTGTVAPPPTYSAPNATAPHVQVQIGLNSTNTHQVNFAQIVSGPGTVVQSAAIEPWTSYTATVSGAGTATVTLARYRIDGDGIDVQGRFTAGTPASTELQFSLPSGYTLNSSHYAVTSVVGAATVSYNTAASFVALAKGATTGVGYINFGVEGASNNGLTIGLGTNIINASGNFISFEAHVAIAELAGRGTVYIGQGTPAYYYCTGTTWGTTNTNCTTQQNQQGVQGGATTPSSVGFTYTFTPTSTIPVGMKPYLELSEDQIHWSPLGADLGGPGLIEVLRNDGTNFIGAQVAQTTSGKIAVTFGKYAYGTSGAWNGTWYWRVFVGYPSQAQGFANVQPGVSAGLVPASGLPGNTTGNSAATNNVGERIGAGVLENSSVSLTNGAAKTITSITLTPGDWDIRGAVGWDNNAATVSSYIGCISLTTNTLPSATNRASPSTGGEIRISNAISLSSNSTSHQIAIPTYQVLVTTNTTFYLIAYSDFSAGSVSAYGYIQARRMD